jgi:hypothetical protein
MAWFAAAIPYISTAVTTGAAVAQGINARARANYDAQVEANQSRATQDQALREEEGLRRGSRLFLGRQAAAIAQAGIGSGGTAGLLAEQSGTLAELDALTLRYQGILRGNGLLASANATRRAGRQDAAASYLLAGGQLLKGTGRIYAGD